MSYNIIRFYRDGNFRRVIIKARVSLEEAQQHCRDPETSSSTCVLPENKRRTKRLGPWFDGYEER